MTNATSVRLAATALLLAPALVACGQNQQQQAAPPPPTVTVAKPVQRGVIDMDEYVGRFVAVDSVEIRARDLGWVRHIHLKNLRVHDVNAVADYHNDGDTVAKSFGGIEKARFLSPLTQRADIMVISNIREDGKLIGNPFKDNFINLFGFFFLLCHFFIKIINFFVTFFIFFITDFL